MRDHILLYINGRPHELRGALAFISLSTFLREHLHLTGTKIVCAEGDCGSCTVLLGRPATGTLVYRPVCSCIQYLFQLDCTHIITIEGLKYDGRLNPIQESMVRNHGAQCGFCTPGFVVSMAALLDADHPPTECTLRRGLVGNLCRCTGYEPILKAGLDTDTTALRPLDQLYDTTAIAANLARHESEPVQLSADGRVLSKPVTLANACAFRAAHPDCLIVSGGTDLGVQANKGLREFRTVLTTRGLRELDGLTMQDHSIIAGASTTIADLEAFAARHLPDYARMLDLFGSPPVRNAGTLGGNIANGSPIGDTMPALLVLNAEVELAAPAGTRRVNINDFYTGYRKNVLQSDELILRIRIPLPAAPHEVLKVYKVSKRKDLDISTFTAAIWMRHAERRIDDVRIAYGGVAPTILRLPRTEESLRGKPLDEASFQRAGVVARGEIKPISDVRGAAEYRLRLAENILPKFFADLVAPVMPRHSSNGKGA